MALSTSQRVAQSSLINRRQSPAAPLWGLLLALPLLLFLVLPLLALILRVQPAALLEHLVNPRVRQAINLSLWTTLSSTLATLLFGTPLAYWLARHRFRGHALIDTLLDLLMVLPPSVAGIALLMAFGRRGLLGVYLNDLGINIAFSVTAVVLAQLFVAAPFYRFSLPRQNMTADTGWPSFYESLPNAVSTKADHLLMEDRIEYHCARCGGHQGHIFDDGPQPTGKRYCNNGLALQFVPDGQTLPALRS